MTCVTCGVELPDGAARSAMSGQWLCGAHKVALGAARSVLGDVSTRGDVADQIGALAAEIADIKATMARRLDAQQVLMRDINDVSSDVDDISDKFDAFFVRSFWQRLRWLLLGH